MFFLLLSLAQAEIQPATNVSLGLSNWRVGFGLDARHGIRVPLFEREDSVLFQGTGLKAQAAIGTSPAYFRGGGQVTFSPLAILDLSGYGMYDVYYGNLQTLIDYNTATANYGSNAELKSYVENDPARQGFGTGWHTGGAATLKIKVGPVIILSSTDVSYWNIQRDEAIGNYFFEREKELMMKFSGDTLLQENALVLYEINFEEKKSNIRIGSITTYRQTFQAEDTLLRTGLIAMYNQSNGLTHALLIQPYLQDRAFTSAFPPFAAYQFRYTK